MLLQTMDQKLGKHEHYRSRLVNDMLFFKIQFLGWSISCDCAELLTSHGSYFHHLFFLVLLKLSDFARLIGREL